MDISNAPFLSQVSQLPHFPQIPRRRTLLTRAPINPARGAKGSPGKPRFPEQWCRRFNAGASGKCHSSGGVTARDHCLQWMRSAPSRSCAVPRGSLWSQLSPSAPPAPAGTHDTCLSQGPTGEDSGCTGILSLTPPQKTHSPPHRPTLGRGAHPAARGTRALGLLPPERTLHHLLPPPVPFQGLSWADALGGWRRGEESRALSSPAQQSQPPSCCQGAVIAFRCTCSQQLTQLKIITNPGATFLTWFW